MKKINWRKIERITWIITILSFIIGFLDYIFPNSIIPKESIIINDVGLYISYIFLIGVLMFCLIYLAWHAYVLMKSVINENT